MPDEMEQKKFLFVKDVFSSSKITRVVIILILVAIYGLYLSLLSPKVEAVITNSLAKVVQNSDNYQINSLNPVFDINVYAGEYNLTNTLYKEESGISNTKFFTIDPRVVAMNKFLADYHSPMASHAKTFITAADQYGLDWRLVASISGVESAFGNIVPGGDSNNGWGWRGGVGGDWSRFVTWDDGIKEITRGLAQGYGTDLTPFDIEPTYCPPCGRNPEHAWANGVTRFMSELNYYVNNLENL